MKRFLLLITCIFSVSLLGQNLHGFIIIDFADAAKAEDVKVTNQNTGQSVLTDVTGSFYLKASAGDTLQFNSPFLKQRKLVLNQNSVQLNPLIVHMNVEVIELPDMIAYAPLTGYLNDDIKTVKYDDSVERIYENLGMPLSLLDIEPKEKREAILPRIGIVPIPTSLNVEALFKSMTGYYRRMENLYEYEDLMKEIKHIKEYLGEDFFVKEAKIPRSEISNFILFSLENSRVRTYINQRDYLSVENELLNKAVEYRLRLEERDRKRMMDTSNLKSKS